MFKLKVNIANHYPNSNNYPKYMQRGKEIEIPKNSTIFPGDLMYDKKHNAIGIVLGCIDENFDGEVRLDSDGMQSIEQLQPALLKHFDIEGVRVKPSVKNEIFA